MVESIGAERALYGMLVFGGCFLFSSDRACPAWLPGWLRICLAGRGGLARLVCAQRIRQEQSRPIAGEACSSELLTFVSGECGVMSEGMGDGPWQCRVSCEDRCRGFLGQADSAPLPMQRKEGVKEEGSANMRDANTIVIGANSMTDVPTDQPGDRDKPTP